MRKLLHACLCAALASAALFASPIIFTPVDTTIGTTTTSVHTPQVLRIRSGVELRHQPGT
jgi:hypothetical protein